MGKRRKGQRAYIGIWDFDFWGGGDGGDVGGDVGGDWDILVLSRWLGLS